MITILILEEFLFILLFFLYRLYSRVDKISISSNLGTKLKRYVTQQNQQNTIYNLEQQKSNFYFNIISLFKLSPAIYKKVGISLLISFVLIVMRVALSYSLIFSHFIYISIFGKTIDIVSFFGPYYISIRNIYYVIYSICIFDIVYTSIQKIYLFQQRKEFKKQKENINSNSIYLGKNKLDESVYIHERGLYQNILITGSIGSGKTSGAVSHILDGFIKNNIYGLVIDVKGSYFSVVERIAKKYGREASIVKISLDSNVHYNPIDRPDLSAIEVAHMLTQVITLLSSENTSDSFWLDKVENYFRDFIILIRTYQTHVDFTELHKLIVQQEYLKFQIECVKKLVMDNTFTDEELFSIQSAIRNIKNEFLILDERTIGIIKAEMTRLTSVFMSDYNIHELFCGKGGKLDFLQNKIVILSIDIGKHRFLSKIVATYLKLDFQRQVLSQSNPNRPVFFIGDEYMEIANTEDAHFFSISREYRCINVISMQSYTSLQHALKNEKACHVILQNFVNKIWFRNDDNNTVAQIIKQLGKEQKKVMTENYTESGQNTRYHRIFNRFKDYKTGISKSFSYAPKLEYKYNEEYFTLTLKTFEATAIISDGEQTQLIDTVYFEPWRGEKQNG